MRKRHFFLALACAALLALPAIAQETDGNIAHIVLFRAKPGMNQQLEDGLKKHMAWHKAQNGTWPWLVWSIETGKDTGGYGAGTFGHKWADFDNPDIAMAANEAEAATSILPYVAEGAEWRFYQMLAKVSKPAPEGMPRLEEVIFFYPEYGKSDEFMLLVKKFHEAIEKTKWPVNYEWYVLMNGGRSPEFVLVLPHDSYADMKGPDKPFPAMLAEAVGQQEAQMMLHHFSKVVKSERSELIRPRPDLGYQPGGGM